MDTMSTKMYTALKSAGAPEENAKEGASVLGELHEEIIKLKSGQRLIQMMVSLNIVMTMAIIGKLFTL
ncbi:MAG TPA: hypothetical protein EYG88_05585 [Desulfocapsa sulfexigens]|nr:hypothetical protein [Desulfocapsa sulfexigens]